MDGATILDYINTGVGIATLVYFVVLYQRGDLVPRKVWNDLTTHIVKETVGQVLKELGLGCGAEGETPDKT